ncbi:MAG: ATP-binding protein [Lachnospiraceae bacterium]|nr:ATP-binding protein [Lachnospiraceae bacterium]
MAKIILICGKICSGKTYYARKLLENTMAVTLSCDDFTKSVFDNELGDRHDAVMAKVRTYFLGKAMEIYHCGTNVILDWGFWTKAERTEITRLLNRSNVLFEWHYIDVSEETLRQNRKTRNQSLEHSANSSDYYVDEQLLAKCLSQFEEPEESEIDVWYVRTADGESDIAYRN